MRRGLIKLMKAQPGILVVDEAANRCEAVELTRKLKPDLILMDDSMPLMDDIEALQAHQGRKALRADCGASDACRQASRRSDSQSWKRGLCEQNGFACRGAQGDLRVLRITWLGAMGLILCNDRGREGLEPSPPSEPCMRFSRTRLSSWWFPHRDWRADS
ncbi:MAG: DNA-binding response regulator [Deltaproteobacteria bacterium]|nr:MAG: DNA-binding response regulator [Deltaproteobacteria bacterium]